MSSPSKVDSKQKGTVETGPERKEPIVSLSETGPVETGPDHKGPIERLSHIPPRLPPFSGDDKDTQFDLWHYEVQCLQAENRPEADIKQAIRRSLKGQAQLTLMSLGIDASVQSIIDKFKTVFGPTLSIQTVLSNFYSMRQKEGEDSGSFANRLEDCLRQAIQLGRVDPTSSQTMLREAFEAGLRTQVRVAVGFLFNLKKLNFDELVVEVKRREKELGLNSAAAVRSIQDSQISELTAQVKQLRTELQTLKDNQRPSSFSGQGGQRPPGPLPNRQTSHTNTPNPTEPLPNYNRQRRPRNQQRGPVTCWRCGQVGHVEVGCRNPLNGNLPVAQANPQANRRNPVWWGGQQ